MGLSASQARLLTITSRKSDCEFQSMNLSHQKLSIARDLENISNEYQNSLGQTKLIYDYYGTGTSTDRLDYNFLMTPSTLNDYTPVTITAASGKVVLNGAYAAAAKAAGIPAEGLGTIPSSEVRNKFLQGLCSKESGLLTESVAKKFQKIPYNQYLGMGECGTEVIYPKYETQLDSGELNENNYQSLKQIFSQTKVNLSVTGLTDSANGVASVHLYNGHKVTGKDDKDYVKGDEMAANVTLDKLLSDDENDQFIVAGLSTDGKHYPADLINKLNDWMMNTLLDSLYNAFASKLKTSDQRSEQALSYAMTKMKENIIPGQYTGDTGCSINEKWEASHPLYNYVAHCVDRKKTNDDWKQLKSVTDNATNYVGVVCTSYYKDKGSKKHKLNSAAGVNVNNIAKAFLTYFADFMIGIENGNIYEPKRGVRDESQFITKDKSYVYIIEGDPNSIDSKSARISQFYDTLLNQICINGWMENNNVSDDQDYLQKMIQNGSMYITAKEDDGFYYQKNYGIYTYVKEITDDEAIARAEAKYNTAKERLSAKEQTIDLKMKNLDTEITSLTTEYDTVKNLLTKNIEKTFKRYSA